MNTDINNIKRKIEILSPAGSEESVYAAVNSGCHAVYIGGKDFNARSGANNFENEDISRTIEYCHLRGVKVYITANTIYRDSELKELLAFLSDVYAYGADAFIMQDIGAAMTVKKLLPDIPIHASTQMTAHSLSDVLFLQKAGFSRIVLSRELSLDEIKNIKSNSEAELECFVHGALCVSYSGQCLMSSFIGARSGNSGKCAQPCRLKYELVKGDSVYQAGNLLSPRDIMTIDIMERIIAAGVTSLKIEGRMKTPEYVALTTKAYREKLDKLIAGNNRTDEIGNKKLIQIFNRGGFSQGYFESHSGKDMMSIKSPKNTGLYLGKVEDYFSETGKCIISTEEPLTPGDGIEIWTKKEPHVGIGISRKAPAGERLVVFIKGEIEKGDPVYKSFDKALMDEAKKLFEKDTRKICIKAYAKAKQGEELYLKLLHEATGKEAEASGAIVERANNQPMSKEKIISQLSKTGGTPFEFEFSDSQIGDNIFIPVAELNAVRRAATDILQEEIIMAYERRLITVKSGEYKKDEPNGEKEISVLVSNITQLDAALSFEEGIKRIYVECDNSIIGNIDGYADKCIKKGIEFFVALSDIDREDGDIISKLETKAITGYLIRNIGQLYQLENIKSKKAIITDYNLNISNRLSYGFMKEHVSLVTLSSEINLADINDIGARQSEIIIYGKTKVMTTAQCPVGLYVAEKGSRKYCKLKNDSHGYYLKDRTGVKMPVITNCNQCIAYIYNDRPVFMLSKTTDLLECVPKGLRLSFTTENAGQTKEILDIAVNTLYYKNSNAAFRNIERFMAAESSFTYGHFYKGVL